MWCFSRMSRVVRPGGVVAVLEFSEPREGPLAPAARFFVNHIVPRLGVLMSRGARDEYIHLQHSIKVFPQPTEFKKEMQMAGLIDVASRMIHPGGVYLYSGKAA
jgi:demethylmenaquinone methyltransferase/2-methoxy-6-polyprenyl-1,4-benzoquinol methylase